MAAIAHKRREFRIAEPWWGNNIAVDGRYPLDKMVP